MNKALALASFRPDETERIVAIQIGVISDFASRTASRARCSKLSLMSPAFSLSVVTPR
jgi:hypothetical protein